MIPVFYLGSIQDIIFLLISKYNKKSKLFHKFRFFRYILSQDSIIKIQNIVYSFRNKFLL